MPLQLLAILNRRTRWEARNIGDLTWQFPSDQPNKKTCKQKDLVRTRQREARWGFGLCMPLAKAAKVRVVYFVHLTLMSGII